MSYKIDEGRLGCLIEIYAEFLERNSDYIIQKNTKLEFFKEILTKIKNDELAEEDIEKIFTKKEEEKKLDSVVRIKYKEEEAKLKLINFLKALVNFEEELRTKNKLDEVIKELVEKMKPLIEGWRIGEALVTELLCLVYPEKYCIKNRPVESAIKKLENLNILSVTNINLHQSYDMLLAFEKELLKYMQNNKKLQNVYHKIIGRTKVNYYDVDAFLYWIIDDNYIEENNPKILNEKIDKKLKEEQSMKTLVNYFQYNGFYFDQDLITAFYSALKTKGFVILSGLTGTGKTKLAQLFAELLCPNFEKHFEIENTKKTQDEQNTQIAQSSSENQNQSKCTHFFLSVRPDWRDSKALLGYYNPITGNYEKTPLLDFILDAINNYNNYITKKDNADLYFIILDEMNLSHVEYYFADFLSVLESGRDENYWTKETIKLHNSEKPLLDNNGKEIPKEVKLPPNLYIIGSVNIDETTYMFSPKVLDRAFTIEFREVNLDSYNPFKIDEEKAKSIGESIRNILLEDLRNKKNDEDKKNDQARFCGAVADKKEIKEALDSIKKKENTEENKERSEKLIFDKLKELNQHLQPYDLHFGYRVLDEIVLFIKYATNAPNKVGKLNPEDALDFAVLMKVLPKFHGPRQKLERPLWLVLNWCLGNKFDNKKFEELIKGIWKELNGEDKRPSIEDFTYVIQKLKSELNNRSKKQSQEAIPESQTIGENQNQPTEESPESTSKVSQEANSESQTIDENQNQTSEESPESTSEAHQTEQTSKNEKATNIDKVKYPRTAIKVLTMLRQLYETGFTSFA
jgi:5-methylcytosine-specific restriction protein B